MTYFSVLPQNVRPMYVATAMTGAKPGFFSPSGETYTRAAVATIGVQKDTHGYLGHAIQVTGV